MAKKEILWRGKNEEDVKKMDLKEFSQMVTARERRKMLHGFTPQEKVLIKDVQNNEKQIKTHCRDMIILPIMVGKMIHVYNGKEFVQFMVTLEMLGHRLGEFALTRKSVRHSAPGIGATRSSAAISVK